MTARRIWFTALVLFSFSPALRADEISDNIQSHLNRSALDALAGDLGAIVGGGSFHSGERLRFPVGFDVGFHFSGVELASDNPILKDNESFAGAGFAQVEIGLPARLNIIGRYGKLFDADIGGGGLRWSAYESDIPAMPSIAVSALINEIDHNYLEGNVTSVNLSMSFDVPILHPYVGVGYDWTHFEPSSRAFSSAPASVDRSIDGEDSGYRAEAGINLSLLPFTYITLGGGVANGRTLGHFGLGIRF